MILKKILLNNFRSHEAAAFELAEGVNVFCGDNGVGKTNVLEAIHFLATAKSHRTNNERDLIRNDSAGALVDSARVAFVRAEFLARGRENDVEGRISPTGKKQFKKNDVPIRKTSDLMGFLSVVMFSPDDLSIIKGAPGNRRKMLDIAICQMSKKYFHLVYSYGRVLAQKNKLLKSMDHVDDERLDVWNEQLAIAGAQINLFRGEYISRLAVAAGDKFAEMMGLPMVMEYVPNGVGCIGGAEFDADELLKLIRRAQKKEVRQRQALIGPHRDDFQVLVGGSDARNFASQGQQRSAVIAMKTAQVEILRERLGEPPVLLLDDVMSELDRGRQAHILRDNRDVQVVITTTKVPTNGKVIKL